MWDPTADFESTTLSNGLSVYAAHWSGRPWETVGFLVHSGARQDPISLEGLAHFVEHQLSYNALVPAQKMIDFFADVGGKASLGLTSDLGIKLGFFVSCVEKILGRALSLFGHMLLQAKLNKYVERERKVIVGEFKRNYPLKIKFDLAMQEHQALYAGDNLWSARSTTPLGSLQSINKITLDDLQSFYDQHFTPANLSVVGVGGLKLTKLVELLVNSPLGGENKSGARTPLPKPLIAPQLPGKTRYIFEMSKYVALPPEAGAFRTRALLPGSIGEQALRILEEMADELLFNEVREKRSWTYDIESNVSLHGGYSTFSVNCSSLALEAVDSVEQIVDNCFATLGEREALFKKVKRQMLARQGMVDITARSLRNLALNDLMIRQRIIPRAEISRRVRELKMADIVEVLKWLKPERRYTQIAKA